MIILRYLRNNLTWFFILGVIPAALVSFAGVMTYKQGVSNNSRVIRQFIYQQLKDCNEKLAAHGEKMNQPVSKYDSSAQKLNSCLEKLDIYKKNINL